MKVAFVLVALVCGGCFGNQGSSFGQYPPRDIPDGGAGLRGGVGATCESNGVCRDGLRCAMESRTCEPVGNKGMGAKCTLSAECLAGFYCTRNGACAESGKTPEGGSCMGEGDCMSGLVCAGGGGGGGTCAKAGTGDLGAACMQVTDCRAGLACAAGACQNLSAVKPWTGVRCPDDSKVPAKAYFEVPRAGAPPNEDFYRLPFPNDIRMRGGKLSLAEHPRPGALLLPFDPTERFLRMMEEDQTGFGLNQAVYFRFSRDQSFASLRREDVIAFYDITKASPDYGRPIGHQWHADTGSGRYICARWLAVRQGFARPLRPGTSYAVILRRGITDEGGTAFAPDEDFKAMLAAEAPSDAALADAWRAYTPLRAWIADKMVRADDLLSAAVFTTEKVEAPAAGLREAVRAAPAPALKGMVRCGDPGVVSPCDDGKTGAAHQLGCVGDPAPGFDEYQGRVSVPVFQQGTPPYEEPAQGGGLELDAAGKPKLQRTEDVCVSLAVPKGTPPAAGWPLVVYGHGTGGSFRSAVAQGLASDLASGGAAVLSYDGVLHGDRRGKSTRSPDELVFNILNPRASRDNFVQGAADMMALARLAEGGMLGTARIDRARLALYGHSQGGNAGALVAAYDPSYGAVVLSGTGGTLLFGLLKKSKPVDVAAALPVALADPQVDVNHPMLNLLQMYFERSDAVNFARRVFADPPAGNKPRHLLHVFGTDDTYAPVETQRTYAQAAGLFVTGTVVDDYMLPTVMAPARGNLIAGMGTQVTAVQVQYRPSGYDGHFVSTMHPSGRRAVTRFLLTYFRDGTPTVEP